MERCSHMSAGACRRLILAEYCKLEIVLAIFSGVPTCYREVALFAFVHERPCYRKVALFRTLGDCFRHEPVIYLTHCFSPF